MLKYCRVKHHVLSTSTTSVASKVVEERYIRGNPFKARVRLITVSVRSLLLKIIRKLVHVRAFFGKTGRKMP